MARLKLAFARDPQRARSRVVLALFTVFALVAIGVPDLSKLGDLAFGQQPSPTGTSGFTIQLLNPSSHSREVSGKQETGGDTAYHLVAWVNRVPPSARAEFFYRTPGEARDIFIAEGTLVGGDTYEAFWDASRFPPDSSVDDDPRTITIKVILYSGQSEVARDEDSAVMMNNQTDTTPVHPTEDQGQTVEILEPSNGEAWGAYQAPGASTHSGVIDVRFSAGTTTVRVWYTLSAPGTEPTWKDCGNETAVNAGDGVRCTVASGDNPAAITAVAATAEDADQSGMPGSGKDSGDAHRAPGYLQTPGSVTISGSGVTMTDTDGATAGYQGPCATVTATVFDQFGRKMAGVNTDIHAAGPTDNLSFDDDEASTNSDRHVAPDRNHTSSEASVDCESTANPKPFSGTQGEHEVAGPGDVKHVETTAGTTDAGTFKIQLYSPDLGTTNFGFWADHDGDDLWCSAEKSATGNVTWGSAGGSGSVGPDTQTCPGPTPTPTATSPSPTPSPTATRTGTPTPTATSTQSSRTITLAADDASVDAGQSVRLSGVIFSGNAGCRDNEFVRIRRRVHGTPTFTDFASATTDANGNYDLPVKVTANSDFQAVAPAHDNCAEASSDPITVLARVRVSIDASDRSVPRGDRVTIFGKVRPNHGGDRVILERKRGDDFVRVSVDTLNRRSRYSFVIRVTWSRGRVFRVSWREQDDDHESNQSETIRIRRQR